MMVLGIDVSRWQGWPDGPSPSPAPDWGKIVKQGVKYAGIRASVADYYIDPMFVRNYEGAAEVGIIPIPYWVIHTDKSDEGQVNKYLEALNGRKPVADVADVEVIRSGDKSDRGRNLYYTMRDIERETHAMGIIYTSKGFWDAHMPDSFVKDFSEYMLWVADYGMYNNGSVPQGDYPRLPNIWSAWGMWQYTSKGKLDGIVSSVDMNLMDDVIYRNLRSRSGIPEPEDDTLPPPPPPTGDLEARVQALEEDVAGIKNWIAGYMG